MLYAGLHFDYVKDEIVPLQQFQTNEDQIKYELNHKIQELLNETYSVKVRDEFLFINNCGNLTTPSDTEGTEEADKFTQELPINKNTFLIFTKKAYSINIYEKTLRKGYIYNSYRVRPLYKFYYYFIDHIKNNTNIALFKNTPVKVTKPVGILTNRGGNRNNRTKQEVDEPRQCINIDELTRRISHLKTDE
jgi:hypothetical protein